MNRPVEIEPIQPARGEDIQPFQGWGPRVTPTQGGASLTLGFGIQPRWGLRQRQRHAGNLRRGPHIKAASGDADVVSTVRGGRMSRDFDEQ